MAAKWQLGSVPIYVSEEGEFREIKRAELFKLDATASTYQFFGAGSKHYTIKGVITSAANLTSLENYAIADTAVTFVTPWASVSNCKIHKEIKATSIRYAGGTFDGTAVSGDTTQLLEVELEIIF